MSIRIAYPEKRSRYPTYVSYLKCARWMSRATATCSSTGPTPKKICARVNQPRTTPRIVFSETTGIVVTTLKDDLL